MWGPAVNRSLPGGQRQRVAIGRAMVRDLKAFLMDEPLSNLDARLRNQMQAEIIKLRQRINNAFIYVTHDQTEAMTLGGRIVIMKDGFVNRIGAPTEVFDKPVSLFDAGFIGMREMNFFSGCRLLLENDVRVPAPCRIPLLGRTLFGMAAVFCNYYAIDHLPLASSNSLNKLAPFFVIFFAALFLKERVERGQLACLLVALTGSLFSRRAMGFFHMPPAGQSRQILTGDSPPARICLDC